MIYYFFVFVLVVIIIIVPFVFFEAEKLHKKHRQEILFEVERKKSKLVELSTMVAVNDLIIRKLNEEIEIMRGYCDIRKK